MFTHRRTDWRSSVGSLVQDIVADARELISQEAQAARLEVQEGVQKLQGAAVLFAVGGVMLLLAIVMVSIMAGLLLNSYTALPVWVCFGIVAGGWALIGVVLLLAGRSKMKQATVLPQETAELAAADVVWMKNHWQARNGEP